MLGFMCNGFRVMNAVHPALEARSFLPLPQNSHFLDYNFGLAFLL